MKKLLLLTAFVATAVGVFAQGTITFNNSSTQLVTNSATGQPLPVGNQFVIALYYGPNGTPEAGLSQIATTPIAAVPGRFFGGTVTTPATTPPGGVAALQVRAYSSGFATYEAAFAAAQGNPSVFVGTSNPFTVTTGNPTGTPATTPASLTPLQSFGVANPAPVPEPSSIALGLLGLGAIVLFRRRK